MVSTFRCDYIPERLSRHVCVPPSLWLFAVCDAPIIAEQGWCSIELKKGSCALAGVRDCDQCVVRMYG